MNATLQHTTWLQFNAFQAKIERKYIPILKREINKQITTFNAYAKEVGFPRAGSQINDFFDPSGIMNIVNNIHAECAGRWGMKVYNDFKGYKSVRRHVEHQRSPTMGKYDTATISAGKHHLVKRFSTSDTIAAQIVQELRLSLLNNVHGITDSIKEEILYYIQLGQEKGWAYDKTAKEISDKVGSTYRSQRIVRTESVKASNMGGILGAKKTGLLMDKTWINAKDKRVRGNPLGPVTQFDHWDMGGVTLPIDQPFLLGSRTIGGASDSLQFPGDPKGNPADIINCRCTLGFVPRRDDNGLPIRVRPREAVN